MPVTNQSIEQRLLAASLAIDNALTDAEIQAAMSEFGYDAARINAGKSLYDAAAQLHQKQKSEYGEQFAATQELQQKWDEATKTYMKQVKVARVALQSDYGAYLKLGLAGNRKRTLSGWLVQARQFYSNALADADVMAKLALFGMTQAKLEAAQTLVDAVEAANAAQKKEIGEAQQATADRDNALDSLEDWLGDFIAIARIALEEKPQLLEKMGVVEPS